MFKQIPYGSLRPGDFVRLLLQAAPGVYGSPRPGGLRDAALPNPS